jgi:hypothetical protein
LGAHRQLDNDILSGPSVFATSLARLTVFCFPNRLKLEIQQCAYVRIRAQNYRSTPTAISSVWTSKRNKLLASEMSRSRATFSGLYLYDRFINKLHANLTKRISQSTSASQHSPWYRTHS